jgi:hypothetical protein
MLPHDAGLPESEQRMKRDAGVRERFWKGHGVPCPSKKRKLSLWLRNIASSWVAVETGSWSSCTWKVEPWLDKHANSLVGPCLHNGSCLPPMLRALGNGVPSVALCLVRRQWSKKKDPLLERHTPGPLGESFLCWGRALMLPRVDRYQAGRSPWSCRPAYSNWQSFIS